MLIRVYFFAKSCYLHYNYLYRILDIVENNSIYPPGIR